MALAVAPGTELAVLRWARMNGCPWDLPECLKAAEKQNGGSHWRPDIRTPWSQCNSWERELVSDVHGWIKRCAAAAAATAAAD